MSLQILVLKVKFYIKARSAAASSLSFWIGCDPEPGSYQLHVVVHSGALKVVERGLVHQDPGPIPLHQDVLVAHDELALLQVELVLEARAAATLHTDPEPRLLLPVELSEPRC